MNSVFSPPRRLVSSSVVVARAPLRQPSLDTIALDIREFLTCALFPLPFVAQCRHYRGRPILAMVPILKIFNTFW